MPELSQKGCQADTRVGMTDSLRNQAPDLKVLCSYTGWSAQRDEWSRRVGICICEDRRKTSLPLPILSNSINKLLPFQVCGQLLDPTVQLSLKHSESLPVSLSLCESETDSETEALTLRERPLAFHTHFFHLLAFP